MEPGSLIVYVIRVDRTDVAALAERYDLDHVDGYDATAVTRVIRRRAAGS